MPSPSGPSSDTVRPFALAALLGVAGVAHLARPGNFDQIVPQRLPGSPRAYTYVSGLVELALAVALLRPGSRKLAGPATAVFFAAVFPANVKMAVDVLASPRAGTGRKVAVLLRLPLQVPLIRAALRVR